MAIEYLQIAPAAVIAGAATWVGKAVLEAMRSKGERQKTQVDADIRLEEHRDKLTFDLLAAARSEVATLRQEVGELRPLQARLNQLDVRLAHFEEALEFVERLMSPGTPEERLATERQARAFITRMRRLADAHGTLANEAQIERSVAALPDDIKQKLGKLP